MLGVKRTHSVKSVSRVGLATVVAFGIVVLMYAEKEATITGVDGYVLYVTEVTIPNVPPPPPRSAQKRSEFWYALAVR